MERDVSNLKGDVIVIICQAPRQIMVIKKKKKKKKERTLADAPLAFF